MAKGIKRKLSAVRDKIDKQISASIDRSNMYSRGLAREGYNGGYIAALDDVMLALDGLQPNRNGWWDDEERSSAVGGEHGDSKEVGTLGLT